MAIGARIILRPTGAAFAPVETAAESQWPAEATARMRRIHQATEHKLTRDAVIFRQRNVIVAFQAGIDAEFALEYCIKHAHTREQQELAHAALRAKCDILWAQLDALYYSYVNPGWPPPGAFQNDKAL